MSFKNVRDNTLFLYPFLLRERKLKIIYQRGGSNGVGNAITINSDHLLSNLNPTIFRDTIKKTISEDVS